MGIMSAFEMGSFTTNDIDDFDFVVRGKRTYIVGETIVLSRSVDLTQLMALSYALAQSTKLSVFEDNIDNTIDLNKDLAEGLANTGSTKLSRLELSKRIGKLILARAEINLHSDLLDIPEVFWSDFDEQGPLYKATRQYLDMDQRLVVCQRRLDVLGELFHTLREERNFSHELRLEWIIIWLIVLEVVAEIAEFTATYFLKTKP